MKASLILIATALLFFSCKKEKIDIQDEGSSVQFNTPTTKGSYWIYHYYEIDTNGVETKLLNRDSLVVLGDTLINNLEYTAFENFSYSTQNQESSHVYFVRDSCGYRVSRTGDILYTASNFSDTISKYNQENIWQVRTKMFKDIQVSVPAGSFSAIEARRHYYSLNGGAANSCGDVYFTLGSWYAAGIGKIKETTGYILQIQNCGNRIEIRLVDYYIAP